MYMGLMAIYGFDEEAVLEFDVFCSVFVWLPSAAAASLPFCAGTELELPISVFVHAVLVRKWNGRGQS